MKATIFCHAHPNIVTREVNAYGKLRTFNNGGFRLGLVVQAHAHAEREEVEDVEAIYYNRKATTLLAAECFAVLKAVELALSFGFTDMIVRSNTVAGWQAAKRVGTAEYTYLSLARRMVGSANAKLAFLPCTGEDNIAEEVSQLEGAPPGVLPPPGQPEPLMRPETMAIIEAINHWSAQTAH